MSDGKCPEPVQSLIMGVSKDSAAYIGAESARRGVLLTDEALVLIGEQLLVGLTELACYLCFDPSVITDDVMDWAGTTKLTFDGWKQEK